MVFSELVIGINKSTKEKESNMKKYINYDVENTFNDSLDNANDKQLEKLLKEGIIKSVYTTKTVKAGKIFDVEIYPEFTRKQQDKSIRKRDPTAQKNLNDRNAKKKLERLIQTNFSNNDLYLTFTYDENYLPPDIEQAEKSIKNFIRRINYRRKKEGLNNAKYIYITEYSHKKKIRCHHHLIMDGALEVNTVDNMWKCGYTKISRIRADENGTLSQLSSYLSKDPAGTKRWTSSINLKKPVERKSYTRFTARKVKRIVEQKTDLKQALEQIYKRYEYIKHEIRYNAVNNQVYIYARMIERNRQ